MASTSNPPPRMSHQDRLRLADALAVLQSPELLMRTAIKNGQSTAATRLAFEKQAAGIKERYDARYCRKDVTAAEDTFKPDWMIKEEEQQQQEQQRRKSS